MFKFKEGDRVRVIEQPFEPHLVGEEAVVTKLGGVATPDKGAVVTNEKFPCGDKEYGEHGLWMPDDWLEPV